MFRNSLGHGVVGYDLAGKIVLDRINITEDRKVNTTYITGGILMVFTDNEVDSKIQTVSIQNLQITNICSSFFKYKPNKKNQLTDAVAIGIAFYQSNYSVYIQIKCSNIMNITSYKGSHIYIAHKPYAKNIVEFGDVSFINNTNRQDLSLFKVKILNVQDNLEKKFLMLIIKRCVITHNVMTFWQPFEQKLLLLNLTITLTKEKKLA